MKYHSIIASVMVSVVMLPTAASAAKRDHLLLDPSSKWNVHVGEDYCRLARSFGTGDQQIMLQIDRFGPSASFHLNFLGQPMKRAAAGIAQIQFGPEFPSQSLDFYVGSGAKDTPAWIFAKKIRLRPHSDDDGSDAVDPDATAKLPSTTKDEAMVSEVMIGSPLRQPIILRTGPMKNAFAVLNACTQDLIASWGLDIEQHRTAQRRPVPLGKPERWVTASDYPSDMLRKRQPGLVEFRLMIDVNGKATDCHIQQSTNPDGFDDVVCDALMRRATFEPALDKHGQPMPSYYRNRVRFHM